MTEHPIFVPFEDEHLAAVVTLPESTPRGLVLMMQGLGAPRSHRYRLWTRTARSLAERGIASVRMDYPELGDSTGAFPAFIDDPPVREALAVGRTAMTALGVDRLAVVGNCLGARAAVALAAATDVCSSICCILPSTPKSILQGAGRTGPHRAARRLGKRLPRVARAVRRVVPTRRIKPRLRFVPEVLAATQSSSVMFLYLGAPEGHRRLESAVASLVAWDGDRGTERTEVQLIRAGDTSDMRLPLDLQPLVIERIVDWMDRTLPATSQASVERARSTRRTENVPSPS